MLHFQKLRSHTVFMYVNTRSNSPNNLVWFKLFFLSLFTFPYSIYLKVPFLNLLSTQHTHYLTCRQPGSHGHEGCPQSWAAAAPSPLLTRTYRPRDEGAPGTVWPGLYRLLGSPPGSSLPPPSQSPWSAAILAFRLRIKFFKIGHHLIMALLLQNSSNVRAFVPDFFQHLCLTKLYLYYNLLWIT